MTVGNQNQPNLEEHVEENDVEERDIDSLAENLEENCLMEEECETSEVEDSSCSVQPLEADPMNLDKILKENSALKERLDNLLMCQICFESVYNLYSQKKI